MESMTDQDRLQFQAQVAAVASKIVNDLMKGDNNLGPVDAAFALGASAKLIASIASMLNDIPLEEVQAEIRKAFNTGFTVTQPELLTGQPH